MVIHVMLRIADEVYLLGFQREYGPTAVRNIRHMNHECVRSKLSEKAKILSARWMWSTILVTMTVPATLQLTSNE